MIPNDEWYKQLEAAKSDISHRTDGPVNSFVAINRAMKLAADQKYSAYLLANALDAVLQQLNGRDLESIEYG